MNFIIVSFDDTIKYGSEPFFKTCHFWLHSLIEENFFRNTLLSVSKYFIFEMLNFESLVEKNVLPQSSVYYNTVYVKVTETFGLL